MTNCLNCEKAVPADAAYCPACGQKADTHRFTWSHFFHEWWHALTHTDKGILALLKGLATQPGRTVSEYVDGKRKKYFNPITFLLICIAVFTLATTKFNTFGDFSPPGTTNSLTAAQKEMSVEKQQRLEEIREFRTKHPNLIALVGLPLQALLIWLFFRKRGRNYVEILIAVIFLGGFAQLIFSVLMSMVLGMLVNMPGIYFIVAAAGLIGMLVYMCIGLKGLLSKNAPLSFWKVFPVLLLYYLVFVSLIGIATWVYVKKIAN